MYVKVGSTLYVLKQMVPIVIVPNFIHRPSHHLLQKLDRGKAWKQGYRVPILANFEHSASSSQSMLVRRGGDVLPSNLNVCA